MNDFDRLAHPDAARRRALRAAERAGRVQKRRSALLQNRLVHERSLAKAHARWEAGYVIPDRITMFLDARGLYGPEVDLACGVEEPTVDQWEAGEVYPTWEQLVALTHLVELRTPLPLTDAWGSSAFLTKAPWWPAHFRMNAAALAAFETPPILRFSREALNAHRARLTEHQETR